MAKTIEYGAPIALADARRVLAACEAYCVAREWPMAIAIVDSAGRLILHVTMDGTQNASIAIARAKAECAVNFKRETKVFEDRIASGGINLKALAMPGVIPVEGGVPLMRNGTIIGAIGVSGMASGEDGEAAKAAAAVL
jgi:glc operon protein GlcG